MRLQRRTRDSLPLQLIEIGPEVVDRLPLETQPSAATVASYVLTQGASRAWEAINNQLSAGQGALFWIGGSAGAGKTHFLNYVLALSARAGGVLGAETGRHITLPIEVSAEIGAAGIDRRIIESLEVALTGDDRPPALWSQMRGTEALTIAFDRARRQGVQDVTIVIDFGLDENQASLEILPTLAEVGRSLKKMRLIVVAAGRGEASQAANKFDVTPGGDEEIAVAVGRARNVDSSALPMVDGLYGNLEGSFDARAIYPLHPTAADALRSLYARGTAIGTLAKAIREVIEPWHGEGDFRHLIMLAALMRSAVVRQTLDAHLGVAGRASYRIATAAARANADSAGATLQALVDTLVLLHVGSGVARAPITRIREWMDSAGVKEAAGAGLGRTLATLANRSQGAIVYDVESQLAGFDPRGAGSPDLTAFNSALVLVRSFDPSMTAAHEMPELKAKRSRLRAAMAAALEGACRNRETLAEAMRESGGQLSIPQQQAFAAFIELAEGGAAALIELSVDPQRREAAMAVIAAYEVFAVVADSIPRLRRMRQYLAETRLLSVNREEAGRDRALVDLETECQMLAVALNPAALAGAGRKIDTLEDRFQTFKATYVQRYRLGHEHNRLELVQLAPAAADTRRHLEVLGRLNAIAALGPPNGDDLAGLIAPLNRRLRLCDLEGSPVPEVTPCCPRCDYLLGTLSPREELYDLLERTRRALQSKLAALAQSAIARLIDQHDRSHRLEGFLKIVQAAQTDSLIRVLDDELASYLTRLLDENASVAIDEPAKADAGMVSKPATRAADVALIASIGIVPPASGALGRADRQSLRGPPPRRKTLDRRNGRNGRALKSPPDVIS
jgi:hypothetical protein